MRVHYERVPFAPHNHIACNVRREAEFPFHLHSHPEYELTWIRSGRGMRAVGHNMEAYMAEELVLLGPNVPHCWTSRGSEENHAMIVQFDEEIFGTDFLRQEEAKPLAALLENSRHGLVFSSEVALTVAPLLDGFSGQRGLDALIVLLQVLRELSQCDPEDRFPLTSSAPEVSQTDSKRLNELVSYLHYNLDSSLKLEDAAKVIHMTPRSFSRLLQQTMGKTFTELVNAMRIHRACDLLLDSSHSVAEVCFLSGFQNLSHFNRQFRRLSGVTPREYRAQFGRPR